jgi:hypothetical protein
MPVAESKGAMKQPKFASEKKASKKQRAEFKDSVPVTVPVDWFGIHRLW